MRATQGLVEASCVTAAEIKQRDNRDLNVPVIRMYHRSNVVAWCLHIQQMKGIAARVVTGPRNISQLSSHGAGMSTEKREKRKYLSQRYTLANDIFSLSSSGMCVTVKNLYLIVLFMPIRTKEAIYRHNVVVSFLEWPLILLFFKHSPATGLKFIHVQYVVWQICRYKRHFKGKKRDGEQRGRLGRCTEVQVSDKMLKC